MYVVGINETDDLERDGRCFSISMNFLDDSMNFVIPAISQLDQFVKPIPLTEEWLLKFGFTNYEWCTDCAFIKFNNSHIMLRYFNDKWYCTKTKVSKDSKGHKMSEGKDIVRKGIIKHVHQLQNLYFALTGEELTKN